MWLCAGDLELSSRWTGVTLPSRSVVSVASLDTAARRRPNKVQNFVISILSMSPFFDVPFLRIRSRPGEWGESHPERVVRKRCVHF